MIWKFSLVISLVCILWNFTGISLVSLIRETIMKLSIQSWKTWELDHLTCDWTYTWDKSQKHPKNMFFTQKHLEKFWKTWVIQITSKSKQKEQKYFWFDPHMVEHTHIPFDYVHPHKWNKHSLNIKLVCCVCVKCGIVLSLEWSFNDQFNQVIYN